MYRSPTTPKQYYLLTMPRGPPQSSPSVHSSTTPQKYYLLTNADIPRADGTPLIDPKCTEPYYTKTVLSNDQGTWTTPSLLTDPSVHSSTTPQQYYILTNADIPRADGPPPHQPQVHIALLHQNSITYPH